MKHIFNKPHMKMAGFSNSTLLSLEKFSGTDRIVGSHSDGTRFCRTVDQNGKKGSTTTLYPTKSPFNVQSCTAGNSVNVEWRVPIEQQQGRNLIYEDIDITFRITNSHPTATLSFLNPYALFEAWELRLNAGSPFDTVPLESYMVQHKMTEYLLNSGRDSSSVMSIRQSIRAITGRSHLSTVDGYAVAPGASVNVTMSLFPIYPWLKRLSNVTASTGIKNIAFQFQMRADKALHNNEFCSSSDSAVNIWSYAVGDQFTLRQNARVMVDAILMRTPAPFWLNPAYKRNTAFWDLSGAIGPQHDIIKKLDGFPPHGMVQSIMFTATNMAFSAYDASAGTARTFSGPNYIRYAVQRVNDPASDLDTRGNDSLAWKLWTDDMRSQYGETMDDALVWPTGSDKTMLLSWTPCVGAIMFHNPSKAGASGEISALGGCANLVTSNDNYQFTISPTALLKSELGNSANVRIDIWALCVEVSTVDSNGNVARGLAP